LNEPSAIDFASRNSYSGGMDASTQIAVILQDFLTAEQAAKRLRITLRAVQTACARGQLPGAVQLGREWRIPQAAVSDRLRTFGRGPIPQKRRKNRPAKSKSSNDLRDSIKN
jgi:excisionase family DNA binding protein